MTNPTTPERPRPETDKYLTDRNQGPAERAVLGANPFGSMARIIVAVIIFVVLFGTIFFLSQK